MTWGPEVASLTPSASYHLQSLGLVGKTFPECVVMRVPSRSKPATWHHQGKNNSSDSDLIHRLVHINPAKQGLCLTLSLLQYGEIESACTFLCKDRQ